MGYLVLALSEEEHIVKMIDPVAEQPVVEKEKKDSVSPAEESEKFVAGEASEGGIVVKSSSWWGVSNLTQLISSPHVLEESLNNVASQVAQATSGASQMVKSKSMEVMKAVTGDLTEVKDNLGQYTEPIKKAGGLLKTTLTDLDEATDEMAEVAIQGVTTGASSLWKVASGYASQMFTEDDLPSQAVLAGSNNEPIILDRTLTPQTVVQRTGPLTLQAST